MRCSSFTAWCARTCVFGRSLGCSRRCRSRELPLLASFAEDPLRSRVEPRIKNPSRTRWSGVVRQVARQDSLDNGGQRQRQDEALVVSKRTTIKK